MKCQLCGKKEIEEKQGGYIETKHVNAEAEKFLVCQSCFVKMLYHINKIRGVE